MSSQPLLQTSPGKRIALPTRIEPKVFFANERTFLSWLNFTAILGGLAIGLLNFGDRVGQISAALFTLVAMATMLYALYTFHWRARVIRLRSRGGNQKIDGGNNQQQQQRGGVAGGGGFDDRFGPTVLAFALLGAVVVNFVLRVVVEGEGRGGPRQGQDQGVDGGGAGSSAGAGTRVGVGVGTGTGGLVAVEELGYELR